MDDIQKKIKSFLEKYELDKPESVYLVAFSGGYDSMCLLHALKNVIAGKIVAIHLNHNWRGAESANEEKNCKNFCDLIGVEFYSETLGKDIAHTETAAREARYLFFENCAKKFNSNIIFTAHNKNDNAETLIYRICKGTGIAGLQGIAEHRGIYYRPLLDVCRHDIENYCIENGLSPNNDSSNSDTKYKRNFIRAKILPQLAKGVNTNIVDTLNSLSEVAKEETEIVEEYLALILDKISENGKFITEKFLEQNSAVQKRLIYNIFIRNNLEYDREKILNIWDFIKENSCSKSGKTCSLTTNLWIFVSDKYIELISKNNQEFPRFNISKEGVFESNGYILEIEKFSGNVETFPADCEQVIYANLSDFPYELRLRQDGDIIYPLGANGSQKLKKYLNSKKIPNHEKDNLLFLTKNNEILWAIGLGISEKIKVVDKPTHRLKFYKKEVI